MHIGILPGHKDTKHVERHVLHHRTVARRSAIVTALSQNVQPKHTRRSNPTRPPTFASDRPMRPEIPGWDWSFVQLARDTYGALLEGAKNGTLRLREQVERRESAEIRE